MTDVSTQRPPHLLFPPARRVSWLCGSASAPGGWWVPHYPSRAPSQQLPISAGWAHLQPSASALRGGGRCVVKGARDSAGLLGARGGKRRGSGFGHHD